MSSLSSNDIESGVPRRVGIRKSSADVRTAKNIVNYIRYGVAVPEVVTIIALIMAWILQYQTSPTLLYITSVQALTVITFIISYFVFPLYYRSWVKPSSTGRLSTVGDYICWAYLTLQIINALTSCGGLIARLILRRDACTVPTEDCSKPGFTTLQAVLLFFNVLGIVVSIVAVCLGMWLKNVIGRYKAGYSVLDSSSSSGGSSSNSTAAASYDETAEVPMAIYESKANASLAMHGHNRPNHVSTSVPPISPILSSPQSHHHHQPAQQNAITYIGGNNNHQSKTMTVKPLTHRSSSLPLHASSSSSSLGVPNLF